jgi:UDP-glucose 4-epimerase
MKILITGVAGFVGSTIARKLLATEGQHYEITGIDNFSFGYKERLIDLNDRIDFIEGDIADSSKIPVKDYDVIIHCAAIAPLPECQINSHRAIVQNVANCGSITDFALNNGIKNIIFFSSGAIYEGVDVYPTPETVSIRPRLVYPTTKYLAEEYFKAMCRSHALNVTSIRLFNLYGPHQDYFRKQPPLIGYLLSCLLKNEQAVLFSSGNQKRDYIYIDDLVDLVLIASSSMQELSEDGNFIPVNAGMGHPISVNRVIELIEVISNKKIQIERRSAKTYWEKYPEIYNKKIALNTIVIEDEVNKFTHADTNKLEDLFDWSPKITMEFGLNECLKHAKKIFGVS